MEAQVNIVNRYSPLKEVLLGDVDYGAIPLLATNQRDKVRSIFEDTERDLNDIQQILEGRGVVVHRPKPMDYLCGLQTPKWAVEGIRIPLCPRDIYAVIGSTVVECAEVERNRYFEHWAWSHIFTKKFFDPRVNFVAMPRPTLSDDTYTESYSYVTDNEILMAGANLIQHHDTIFIGNQITGNDHGVVWFQKNFPNHKFIKVDFPGHLDTHFNILRDGLVLSYHPREKLPEFFANWDIIHVIPNFNSGELISDAIQDDDFEGTVLAVNLLSLNEHAVMLYEHMSGNTYLRKQFDKYNIEQVFVPFRHAHFFNQGISCITLDIVRE